MVNFMRINILFFSLFLLSMSSWAAAESVHEYRLPNGLKLLVKEDHRVPIVVTEVWYKVGSSYEPDGITGISHALEHMMFKGSKKYGPGLFSKIVSENGGQENAFTSYDYTAYYQMMEADKLPVSLQLEADRMRNLLLRAQDFANELNVVKEERRLRTDDNPQEVVYERFLANAHIATTYHHPVIGWMDDLNHLTVENLRKWYEKWYAPNNAIVVVVGDVNPDKVHTLVQQNFGQLKPIEIKEERKPREIPNPGFRHSTISVPAKLPWLVMGYNVPVLTTAADQNEPYALDVLQAILDGGDSARLSKELVRGKQIATSISTSYDLFSRLDNVFVFSGIPAQGHTVKELQQALVDQVKRLQTTLVDAKELSRVKAQVIANKVYNKDSILNQANEIGALESVGLSWKLSDDYVKRIEAITPEQIQAVARKYLVQDRLTVAELNPLPLTKKAAERPSELGGQHVR